MFCPFCGEKNEDDAVFCAHCGSKIQEPANTINDAGTTENQQSYVEHNSFQPGGMKEKNNAKLIGMVVAGVVAIVALAVGIKIFGALFNRLDPDKMAIVTNSDGYYLKKDITNEKQELIKISSFYSYDDDDPRGVLSENGKYYVFFSSVNEYDYGPAGRLCLVELGKLGNNTTKNERLVKEIDDQTSYYADSLKVFNDGSVLYSKVESDNNSYRVYYYNGKEDVEVASNVNYVEYMDEGGMIYTVDTDNGNSIYYKDFKSDKEATKLAANATSIVAKDLEHILYQIYYEDLERTSLYETSYKQEEGTLITDNLEYSNIYQSYTENGEFYYTTKEVKTELISDYFTDLTYNEDAAMKEPDSEDPKYIESQGWFSTDYTDEYYELKDKYDDAQYRIALNQDIQGVSFDHEVYALNFYSDGKSTKICDSVGSHVYDYSGDADVFVYYKTFANNKNADINLLAKKLDYYYEEDELKTACEEILNSPYEASDRNTIYFTVMGGKEQSVPVSDFKLNLYKLDDFSAVVYDDGAYLGLVFNGSDESDDYVRSNVFVASISGNMIGNFQNVEGLDANSYLTKYGDRLVANTENRCQLVVDGKAVLLEENRDYLTHCESYKDGTMCFISNYDSTMGGTLYIVDKKGNKTKVGDDITTYKTLANGDILFVHQGNLQRFSGNKTQKVANDVDGITVFKEKEINIYYIDD